MPTRRHLLAHLAFFGCAFVASADDRPVVDDSGEPREKPAADSRPTLWIAGDSTVKNQGAMRGWGQEIGAFLDPEKVQVANRAIGGRSSRTFLNEGRWQEILDGLEPGDLVLVQFGHNDVGPLDERGKFRGSIKGTGDGTEEVAKPDGSVETVRSYGWYLKYYARSAKGKGATVVLCSPVPHRKFGPDGRFVPGWDEWSGWVRECAGAEGVHFADLAGEIGGRYDVLGPEAVGEFFADERTHTNAAGAAFNARAVVASLKKLPDLDFARFLNDEGRKVE